jgi:hypothetical protein
VNLLYGPDYGQHYSNGEGPWQFEAQDNAVHVFFSRLARTYLEEANAIEILAEGQVEADRVRSRLADHNHALVSELVDLAEEGEPITMRSLSESSGFVDFVRARGRELRSAQVKSAMLLRRAGFSLEPAGLAAGVKP